MALCVGQTFLSARMVRARLGFSDLLGRAGMPGTRSFGLDKNVCPTHAHQRPPQLTVTRQAIPFGDSKNIRYNSRKCHRKIYLIDFTMSHSAHSG